MDDKKKIYLEYELNATSPSAVWPIISEATGLERWMADEVEREDDKLTFTWGTSYMNKDTKTATIVKEKAEKFIRFKWDDDTNPDAYCELRIEVGEITNDCILAITDYADDGDTESLKDIWDENVQMLHQNTGI